MSELKFMYRDEEEKTMSWPFSYEDNNMRRLHECSNPKHVRQYTGLKDKTWKEIYEGDIVAFKDKSIYHFLDRKGSKPRGWIRVNKEKGINNPIQWTENVIYGNECLMVEWQDIFTWFYPFADSPDNCQHCWWWYNPILFKIVWNIYENPDLLSNN